VQDPTTPLQWRQTRAEGGGVLGDIGSHLIDLAHWLLGPIARVRCDLRTFTRERPISGGRMAPVDVDDAASCWFEFAAGAVGVMNVSGVCLGRGNHQRIEVYGTKGGVVYEIDAPADRGGDRLEVCFGAAQHRTAGMATALTRPRHQATPLDPFLDFFRAIRAGRRPAVTFDDALRVQAVLEAAEESAAAGGAWIDVPATGKA
jgi:predicted dehydrogenase